jgi:hypothetical protein
MVTIHSVGVSRRLDEDDVERRLSGSVKVEYSIAVPSGVKAPTSQTLENAESGMTTSLNTQMAKNGMSSINAVGIIASPVTVTAGESAHSGGGSSSDSSSGSSGFLGMILGKLFLLACIGTACVGVVLLIAYGVQKLRGNDQVKGYMAICTNPKEFCQNLQPLQQCETVDPLEVCRNQQDGLAINFNTEAGTKFVTFKTLPLSMAFWDEAPMRVCTVKDNSEAERLGVKAGWVVTSVNGQSMEGLSPSECVTKMNTIAVDLARAGAMKRVVDENMS